MEYRNYFHDLFSNKIPEVYKKRYGIKLRFPRDEDEDMDGMYADVKEAGVSIIPDEGSKVSIIENEEKLIIRINNATIHLYKKFHFCYTII